MNIFRIFKYAILSDLCFAAALTFIPASSYGVDVLVEGHRINIHIPLGYCAFSDATDSKLMKFLHGITDKNGKLLIAFGDCEQLNSSRAKRVAEVSNLGYIVGVGSNGRAIVTGMSRDQLVAYFNKRYTEDEGVQSRFLDLDGLIGVGRTLDADDKIPIGGSRQRYMGRDASAVYVHSLSVFQMPNGYIRVGRGVLAFTVLNSICVSAAIIDSASATHTSTAAIELAHKFTRELVSEN